MSQKKQSKSMTCMVTNTIAMTQTTLTTTTPMRRNLIEAQKESSQGTMIQITSQNSIRRMKKSFTSAIFAV
jgi:hypothetical protein